MKTYYTLVGVVLTAVIFFAVGRSTVSSPKPAEKPPAPYPAPAGPVAERPASDSRPAPVEKAKEPAPGPAPRKQPAAMASPFLETILDGTGTGDFAIEEVVYRDHPMGDSHLEREIRITYRNDASLTRVFTMSTRSSFLPIPNWRRRLPAVG